MEKSITPEQLLRLWRAAQNAGSPLTDEQFCRRHNCLDLLDELRRLTAAQQAGRETPAGDVLALTELGQSKRSKSPKTERSAERGTANSELKPKKESAKVAAGRTRADAERTARRRTDPAKGVFGDYQLLEMIGKGGMGVVYKAWHAPAGRMVALKLIRPDRLSAYMPDERRDALARFQNEVRAAAQLDHENVVTVFDVGEVDGQPYYAMRYVDGRSLSEMLLEGPLSGKRAARYLEQAARALAEGHAKKILHRDLKPHNILIDAKTDRALLTDFGLAKLIEGDQQLTATDTLFGSPPYMSPEQARDAKDADFRSDVYSLGAALYHVVTGRPPFQAANLLETLRQVRDVAPVPPAELNPAVDRDLETICLHCLEKDPARRYSTAAELADELRRYQQGLPILARRTGPLERTWRWCKRHPTVSLLATSILLLLIVGLAATSALAGIAIYHADRARVAEIESNKEALRSREEALRADSERDRATDQARRAESAEKQADAEAERAKAAEELAIEKAAAAEQALYFNLIALAKKELDDGGLHRAAGILAKCPPEFRRWEWRYLDRLCQQPVAHLAHAHGVGDIAFSPGGGWLAVANGHQIEIRSAELLASEKTLSAGDEKVLAIAWIGEQTLAAGDAAGNVRIWDVEAATAQTLLHHAAPITALAGREPDQLLLGDEAGRVILLNVGSGTIIREFPADGEKVAEVALSPDGRLAAAGLNRGATRVWDVETGEAVLEKKITDDTVRGVAFSPDSSRLVSYQGDVRVFDLATGQQLWYQRSQSDSEGGEAKFSPDGRLLATTSGYNRRVRVWEAETGVLLYDRPLGYANYGHMKLVSFSADGTWLAAAGTENPRVAVWPAELPSSSKVIAADVMWPLSTDAENRWLAARGADPRANNQVVIFRKETQEPFAAVTLERPVRTFALLPEERIAALDIDGVVHLVDFVTGEMLWKRQRESDAWALLVASPDGARLAIAEPQEPPEVWNAATGETEHVLPWKGHSWKEITFSPDSRWLGGGGLQQRFIWDCEAGRAVYDRGSGSHVFAFHPDGRQFAIGYREVELFDAMTGERTLLLSGHQAELSGVTFSPDGKRIFTCGRDAAVRVWDGETGAEILELTLPNISFGNVHFDAAHDLLVTESGEIRIWGDRLPRYQPGVAVDVLPAVRPAFDAASGNWRLEDGALRAACEQRNNVLALPYRPMGSYVLTAKFQRLSSSERRTVGFILPAGEGTTMLALDHEERHAAGLDRVQNIGVGFYQPPNPTVVPLSLSEGETHELKVEVRLTGGEGGTATSPAADTAHIQAWLNGEPLVDWSGPQAHLDMHPNWELTDKSRLGLAAGPVDVEFVGISVEMIDGELLALRRADRTFSDNPPFGRRLADGGAEVDLLNSFDPENDTVSGTVRAEEGWIYLRPDENEVYARAQIPVRPRGAYTIEGAFAYQSESEEPVVSIAIPCGGGRCRFDLRKHQCTGISTVDGQSANLPGNPTQIVARPLPQRARHPFALHVQPLGERVRITAELDGEEFSWTGEVEQLSLFPASDTPLQQTFGLVVLNAEASFYDLTLTVHDGDAWLLRR